jgi:hypothetical protein
MKSIGSNRRNRRVGSWLACLVAAIVVAGHPLAATAADDGAATASNAGLGIASALSSLVYGPIKIVYATLGTVIGGIAWGLSGGDSEVLGAVLLPAVRGDYVVTPSHLRGREPLEFFGHRPGYGKDSVVQLEVDEDF